MMDSTVQISTSVKQIMVVARQIQHVPTMKVHLPAPVIVVTQATDLFATMLMSAHLDLIIAMLIPLAPIMTVRFLACAIRASAETVSHA